VEGTPAPEPDLTGRPATALLLVRAMWQGQDSNLCRQCRRFYRSQRRFLAGPVLSLPGPDHRCDVHKRPVDSFRRPSASPPASPYPERPSVGRREVGGKSRPRAGRQCGPRLRGWAPSLPSGRPATYSPSPRAHSALAGPPTALRCTRNKMPFGAAGALAPSERLRQRTGFGRELAGGVARHSRSAALSPTLRWTVLAVAASWPGDPDHACLLWHGGSPPGRGRRVRPLGCAAAHPACSSGFR
jgi:hypothetical protein